MNSTATFSCRLTAYCVPLSSGFRYRNPHRAFSPFVSLGVCRNKRYSNNPGARYAGTVLMLVMGLGANTVILSLFLYSLLPIIRNTYTGIISIEHAYLESGKAMGMTKFQVLRMVELPLALSVIMAAFARLSSLPLELLRSAHLSVPEDLGDMIVRGSNATNGTAIILAGAIPTAVMAVGADLLMVLIERLLNPVKQKNRRKLIRVSS
nr:ABC transporter permease [Bacillus subtilis]